MSSFIHRWNTASAVLGWAAWLAFVCISASNRLPLDVHEKLFLLAPCVIVPLGLELSARLSADLERGWAFQIARFIQPFGAALAFTSFMVSPGRKAALAAEGWLFVTGLVGLAGIQAIARHGFASMERSCLSVALLYLPVGGAWLVVSRMGASPMGIREPIVLLTAVHFHFLGFPALILVAALGKALGSVTSFKKTMFHAVAIGVMSSPVLVAFGFMVSMALKTLAALLLTLSLAGFSVLTLQNLPVIRKGSGRTLVAVSASSVIAGMCLVSVYAVGDFLGREFISIPQMALFHGTINAVGFALCGVLGWTLAIGGVSLTLPTTLHRQDLGDGQPVPRGGSFS